MKFVSTNLLIFLLLRAQDGISQNSFTNLDFESAKIVLDQSSPYYPYAVNAAKALPGWTVMGGVPGGGDIIYNTVTLGSAAVSIHDTNETPVFGFGLTPIQGNYSVDIQGSDPGTTSAAIGQTGQIPATAHSVTFWAQLGSLQITFDGQVIPYISIGSAANYMIYGGDISQFAGQTGQLVFTALPKTYGFIDNIQFSSSSIPEPSNFALFSGGALFLGIFHRRNFSR